MRPKPERKKVRLVALAVFLSLSVVLSGCSGETQKFIQVPFPVKADAAIQIQIAQEVAAAVEDGLHDRILSRFPDVEPGLLETFEMSLATDTIMLLGGGDPNTTVSLQVTIQAGAGVETILEYGAEEIERGIQEWLRSASVVEQGYAAEFYRMYAEQGHAQGQRDLGMSYRDGRGVPQNLVEAYAWLSIAAAQGHVGAEEKRQALLEEMTPAEVERAEALAQGYWEKYVTQ